MLCCCLVCLGDCCGFWMFLEVFCEWAVHGVVPVGILEFRWDSGLFDACLVVILFYMRFYSVF